MDRLGALHLSSVALVHVRSKYKGTESRREYLPCLSDVVVVGGCTTAEHMFVYAAV